MAWKDTIEEAFGFRPYYLLAVEDGRVRGVLPLFLVQNLLMGKALISTPFAVYGGALIDSAEVAALFRNSLISLGDRLQVQYVELRNAHAQQALGFTPVQRYVTFTQQIGPDEEAILQSIPRKTRYMVRKALKEEFSTRIAADSERFEDLYSRNLRRLGTPCFPRKYFAALFRHFEKSIDIREVVLGGKTVSAVLTFYFEDQVLPYYGASDPEFNAAAPNNFMYYDLMRWGGQNRFRLFDFGRSKVAGSGSYDFKSHWGMEERPLPYETLLVRRKELPNFSPKNPRFDLAIRIWRRMPLGITRALGPYFLRLVP